MREVPLFLLFGVAVLAFAPAALALSADLAISKTGPATITAGTNATYTITVTNNGPDPATSRTLVDNVPPGMQIFSFAQVSGPAWSCSNGFGNASCNLTAP